MSFMFAPPGTCGPASHRHICGSAEYTSPEMYRPSRREHAVAAVLLDVDVAVRSPPRRALRSRRDVASASHPAFRLAGDRGPDAPMPPHDRSLLTSCAASRPELLDTSDYTRLVGRRPEGPRWQTSQSWAPGSTRSAGIRSRGSSRGRRRAAALVRRRDRVVAGAVRLRWVGGGRRCRHARRHSSVSPGSRSSTSPTAARRAAAPDQRVQRSRAGAPTSSLAVGFDKHPRRRSTPSRRVRHRRLVRPDRADAHDAVLRHEDPALHARARHLAGGAGEGRRQGVPQRREESQRLAPDAAVGGSDPRRPDDRRPADAVHVLLAGGGRVALVLASREWPTSSPPAPCTCAPPC